MGTSGPIGGENTLDYILVDKDKGGTPVMSDQLNAQAASFRQHKHVEQRIGIFGEVGNKIPIQHTPW